MTKYLDIPFIQSRSFYRALGETVTMGDSVYEELIASGEIQRHRTTSGRPVLTLREAQALGEALSERRSQQAA